MDLPDKPIIDATLDNVVSTNRSTTLENKDGVSITLVEHILAALRGMDIDNCMIQVNGPEIPILDGSALWFCNVISRCGVQKQKAWREYIHLDSFNSNYVLGVKVDFESWTPQIGIQYAYLDRMSDFRTEIAPARTFALMENDNTELLGMNSTNTIMFSRNKDIKLQELRWRNEPARHKLLDVVGDLALTGKAIKGSLTMIEPGHTKNIEYAKKLLL
jgi:UDP-3-O-[3-hydroxymyristoyl] N-acetylglucosamine deacetylase/3-hydroxyacyl-[acyl-carrier-protein] dehydratase